MNKKIRDRFDDLEKSIQKILASKYVSDGAFSQGYEYVDNELFVEWKSKVKNLLSLCVGENHMYYKEFLKEENTKGMTTNFAIFKRLKSVFNAVKEDYEKGYLTSLRTLVTAEVFDSELEQAQELLDNKYHVAAAVIAGVVLETALRELCDNQNPNIPHGKIDKMNAELKKAGVYNQLQSKKITALADIRNSAAHGKITEFTHDDVQNMIKDIERLLLNHLSEY